MVGAAECNFLCVLWCGLQSFAGYLGFDFRAGWRSAGGGGLLLFSGFFCVCCRLEVEAKGFYAI